METHRRPFRLNRRDGKVMGVCAGIADHFELDVSLVRVAMALAVLLTFPVVLIAYFVLAAIAESGGRRREQVARPRLSPAAAEATRQRMRDLDVRIQAIETYVTSSNTALAREIDELR